MRDAFDAFFARSLGNPLDHGGFVHLIGDFVDDDGKAVFADFLDPRFGAYDNGAAPLQIGFARAGMAQHDATRREIRSRYIFNQLLGGQVRLFDQRQRGIYHFAQIMRRNIGRHADSDAARAIDQHVWKARRQDGWLFLLAVIVVLKIDGIFVDVGQQERGRFVHAHLGITHGGGVIAVH